MMKRVEIKGFSFVFQVVVSSYEAANSIIIELDMDNSLFGFPRELVVAGVGKNEPSILEYFVVILQEIKASYMDCNGKIHRQPVG